MNFLKDKFEILVVTALLIMIFLMWVQSDYRGDIKEFLIAVFGAWLALLKVSTRPLSAIGTASTESGDIITQPPAAEPPKDSKK
jgi:hypothetical protein